MYLKSQKFTEAMKELAEIAEAEIQVLHKKAEENIPKVMPIGSWPSLSNFSWSAGGGWNSSRSASFNNYEGDWFKFYGPYSERDISEITKDMCDKRYADILERIEQLSIAIDKVEEDNKSAIENNKLVREKVGLMMSHIGVAASYTTYEFPTSRSRTKKSVTHSAGYLGDLTRNVPTSISGSKPNIEEYKKKAERLHKDMLSKIAVLQQEKEKKEQEAKQVHELALLRVVYCPNNAFAEAEEILDNLLAKDKYLHLAYWLERNRGDWSDGCNYAGIGINGFVVETEVDEEIEEEIQGHINNWDGDGRVFRDCEYNYNVLYGMGDAALYKDLQRLKSMINDF